MFGAPVRQDGVTVIPVARVTGGGGAGSGESQPVGAGAAGEESGQDQAGSGSGGGFGLGVAPAGVFCIRDGTVTWRPAVDVNRIVTGGQIVAVVALLVLRSYLRIQAGRVTRG